LIVDFAVHHRQKFIGQIQGFCNVMRHINNREGHFALQIFQLFAQTAARNGIQRGKRFIQKQNTRMPRQCLADCTALPFAARHHVRFAFFQMADSENPEKIFNFFFIHRGKRRIVKEIQMRKKIIILENITQAPLLRRDIDAAQRIKPDFIAEYNLSFFRFFQTRQHANDGCFAAAGRTDHHDHVFFRAGK
jgi:hypothetical protein